MKLVSLVHRLKITLTITYLLVLTAGCVSDRVKNDLKLSQYQTALAENGPQPRAGSIDANDPNSVGVLRAMGPSLIIPVVADANQESVNHTPVIELSIEKAVTATLVHSPEIRISSFDAEVAKTEIKKSAGSFDVIAFDRINHDQADRPTSSLSEVGQSDTELFESGLKQTSILGTEWSTSYALTRSWDDLVGRNPQTRYEPVLTFQLKQPLFRDAWENVNMAGVNVARLGYKVALLDFLKKAEDLATEVVSVYWQLCQVRSDRTVYQDLLTRAQQTLDKVEERSEIDATNVQIKQAQVSVKSREALLLQAEKNVIDVQDRLVRLMADPAVSLLDEVTIVPLSQPTETLEDMDIGDLLSVSITHNPTMQEARARVEIADINLLVAKNQKMPRLDLTASASTQSLNSNADTAHNLLKDRQYESYGLGLTLEIPLGGNRVRQAEYQKRKIERRSAVTQVQNIADQVAVLVKERFRQVHMSYREIQIQQQAIAVAKTQLQTLEEAEQVRDQLTPEFLLVKLQAQESLANSERARVQAVTDFNIAMAQLAQATGRVLGVYQLSLPQETETTSSPKIRQTDQMFERSGIMP